MSRTRKIVPVPEHVAQEDRETRQQVADARKVKREKNTAQDPSPT